MAGLPPNSKKLGPVAGLSAAPSAPIESRRTRRCRSFPAACVCRRRRKGESRRRRDRVGAGCGQRRESLNGSTAVRASPSKYIDRIHRRSGSPGARTVRRSRSGRSARARRTSRSNRTTFRPSSDETRAAVGAASCGPSENRNAKLGGRPRGGGLDRTLRSGSCSMRQPAASPSEYRTFASRAAGTGGGAAGGSPTSIGLLTIHGTGGVPEVPGSITSTRNTAAPPFGCTVSFLPRCRLTTRPFRRSMSNAFAGADTPASTVISASADTDSPGPASRPLPDARNVKRTGAASPSITL